MDSPEIETRVKTEIGHQWSRTNAHGVDPRAGLVTPEIIRCRSMYGSQEADIDVWLVLTELAGSRDGYMVVCDQSATQFGLATTTTEGHVAFLGWYGGFWDAFENM
jgi:hypothetical protein